MASRENSSMSEGQMWNTWADCVGLQNGDSDDDDGEHDKNQIESDAMKLRKDDMSLFGFCPAWDDFFLAVCEMCGFVVKPQSLKTHIELRHGNTSLVRNERPEAAVQHSKCTTGKGASSIASHTMPNKSTSSQGTKSSSSSSPRHHNKSTSHSHSSHSSVSHSSNLSCGSKPERTKTNTKNKRNNSMAPIVRMERIPSSLVKTATTPVSTSAEKKELPSPQQPPPVSPASSGIISSSTSGPGPGQTYLMTSLTSALTPSSPSNRQISGIASHAVMKPEGPQQGFKKQASSSKTKKAPKERKLLLCKDREYDPNKHCGVIIADTGKQCTRSLTCKTHSLSLRRAVIGRKKNFDDLLSDHRAAKDATVKGGSVKGSSIKSHPKDDIENHLSLECDATVGTSANASSVKHSLGLKMSANSAGGQFRLPAPPISLQNSTKSVQGIPSNRIPSNVHGCSDTLNLDASISNEEKKETDQTYIKGSSPDPPYIMKHPKPAAVCTFGMRQLGNGLLMMDRRWDFTRAAIRAAISAERNSHPPPLKKLCVESRLPPVPEPVDPSDPYSFTCSETSAATSSVPQVNVSKSAIAVSNPTDVVHSVSVVPTPNSKANKPTLAPTNHVTTHRPAQPKIVSSKFKERTSVPNKKALTNSPSGSNKKKRTSANVPNGTSGVSKSAVLPSLSTTGGAVTLSAVTPSQAVPLSFPLTIGDHLGALSRLQVASRNSITLSPAIIRNTGITTLSGASPSATAKDGSVMVTGLDMLNGQIPVSSALLHSVTVSRPLIATSGSGFGITLGTAGLMGQLSQLPKSASIDGDANNSSNSNSGSNKSSHALSSMLNNSHILNSVSNPMDSSWSRTKAKSKVRKNAKTVVLNSASHSSNIGESTLSSVLQNSIHANISGVTNSGSSPHPLPSPSVTSPLLRSESSSPQVPTSSPLHNGLGPSPPPFFSPKGFSISGTMGSGQQMSVGATSRSSTPSPGIDMSPSLSSGNGHKGKNSSRLPTSLPKQSTVTTGHSTFQVSLPLSFSAVSFGGSTMPGAGTESGQPVSYQQVFASHTLSTAQLHQLKLQPGNRHHGSKASASKTPGSVALATASLPLKLPLLTASGIASSAKQSLRLSNDVSERTAVTKQGSPFPNNLK